MSSNSPNLRFEVRNHFKLRFLAVAAIWGVYALIFAPAYSIVGSSAATLVTVPVAAMAWLFGRWGGLIGALLNILVTSLLFGFVDQAGLSIVLIRWPGITAGLVIGLVIGWLSDLLRTVNEQSRLLAVEREMLKTQIGERERVEVALWQANGELTATHRRLQELDRLKDQFVSNVSHELRTPLANLLLHISLLERGRPEKQAVYRQTLRREADRLRDMIEDLLDLSQLDRDVKPVQLAPIDLNPLIDQLVADRVALAAERGVSLRFVPTPDLTPALIDVALLTQVVSNLLTNALNYTPQGGKVTLLTARQSQAAQNWVAFTVQDTGLGITAKDLPHLFERFYRGEAGRRTSAPGTGLGLAICHEIVARLGGHITVESEPGCGAAFTVWLKPDETRQELALAGPSADDGWPMAVSSD